MESSRSRRGSPLAPLRPSSAHVLPFVTAWYAFAYALGVLWSMEWSSSGWAPAGGVPSISAWSPPGWAPAEGALIAVLFASLLAYVAASALLAVRSDLIAPPSRPQVVSTLAFALVTMGVFATWVGRGRSAFDGEILPVAVACCWPAEIGFRVAFGLFWYGMVPTAAFVLLVGVAGAVTALWQYWLAGWLALMWQAATEKDDAE